MINYKVRIVDRGFNQTKGIDYDLTYSPTLSIDSLKLLLSIASKFNWTAMKLDIKAVYLNVPLDKQLYVTNPPGNKNIRQGFWLLKKALHGLKQSGRQWYAHFSNFLKNNSFNQLSSESCVFKKMDGDLLSCI